MKFFFGACFFIIGLLTFWPLCGISLIFIYADGIEIDLELKKYRTIVSLFGLHFGKWKNLPEIDYVSVFKTSETTTVRALSAEANVKNDIIKINLFYNTNQKIEAYNTQNKEDAFAKAKQIATILNIDILDATERESKWL